MASSLSSITTLTRKVLEITGISIAAVVLLIILFRIGLVVKEIFAPTPPPAPTVAFGKLPAQSFPVTQAQNLTYSINTLNGSLPTLPDRINVYKLNQSSPDLLALDKAKGIAKSAKFLDPPTQLSDLSYKWTRTAPMNATFTMDIQSFDFTFASDYANNTTVTNAANVPDQTLAQTISQDFFDSVQALPKNIDPNNTKTTLLAISNGQLIPATSLSSTQIIRVDYFSKAVDTLPVYTANPSLGLTYALVASGEGNYPQVVAAQYYHKDISSEKATYPIKDVNKAFDELKQGNAFIASNPGGGANIAISNVFLAYYIDPTPQQYLWPIIVFQGDQGFYAYVSAVTDNWIQK